MKPIKTLFIGLLFMLAAPWSHAATRCEQISDNYAATGVWSRDCGPEPGQNFADELAKDCRQTVSQIQARPGASWNSEHGWAPDYACETIEIPAQYRY
jgi:hypothetical protein